MVAHWTQVCGYLGLCGPTAAAEQQPEVMAAHRKLLATAIAKQAQQQKLTLSQVKENLHKGLQKGLQVADDQTCQLCTMAVTYAKVCEPLWSLPPLPGDVKRSCTSTRIC